MMNRLFACTLFAVLSAFTTSAFAADFATELAAIQKDWAVANYDIADSDARSAAFEALAQRAAAFSAQYPDRAEPLIWEGIVLSTFAGQKSGLGALKLAKQARARLDASLDIDPEALDGSAYTSLGTLYYKVPGFPLGFGNKKKARAMLEQALEMNPDGIDPNFFYGELLLEEGEIGAATRYLERGLEAPARPGRELADSGRRAEIRQLLERAQAASS